MSKKKEDKISIDNISIDNILELIRMKTSSYENPENMLSEYKEIIGIAEEKRISGNDINKLVKGLVRNYFTFGKKKNDDFMGYFVPFDIDLEKYPIVIDVLMDECPKEDIISLYEFIPANLKIKPEVSKKFLEKCSKEDIFKLYGLLPEEAGKDLECIAITFKKYNSLRGFEGLINKIPKIVFKETPREIYDILEKSFDNIPDVGKKINKRSFNKMIREKIQENIDVVSLIKSGTIGSSRVTSLTP